MIERRGFLTGLVGFVAAPAIVRASSIMPVKPIEQGMIIDFQPGGGFEFQYEMTPQRVIRYAVDYYDTGQKLLKACYIRE